jgi:hypothetical protein
MLSRHLHRPVCSAPIHDGKHLFALEDLFLQQRLRQAVQGIAVLGQDASPGGGRSLKYSILSSKMP